MGGDFVFWVLGLLILFISALIVVLLLGLAPCFVLVDLSLERIQVVCLELVVEARDEGIMGLRAGPCPVSFEPCEDFIFLGKAREQ